MGKITFLATVVDSSAKWDSKAEEIVIVTKFRSDLSDTNVAALTRLVNQEITVEVTSAQLALFEEVARAK